MLKKLKTSAKLYLLVFTMSILIIVIGIFGIHGMKKMNQNVQTLHTDRMLPLQQLTQIRYSYETGILSSAQQLKHGIIQPQQAMQQIADAEKIIDSNWKAYLKTYFTPEEVKLVQQTAVSKSDADKTIVALKQRIQQATANDDITDKKTYLAINTVIVRLNELTGLQLSISDGLYKSNEKLFRSTETKSYLFIFLSLLSGTLLGIYLIGDTRKFIKDLRVSNRIIKETEEKYRSLVDNAADGIFMVSENGIIFDVNRKGSELLHYTKEELIGKTVLDLHPPAALKGIPVIWDTLKKEKAYTDERKLQRKDGTSIEVEISRKMLPDASGAIAIVRDITEKNLYEQKLARAGIKAQEDERYEIGGELHDNVCQILTSSLIYLGLIEKSLNPEAKELYVKIDEYINLACTEIRNLSHRLAPAFFDNATLQDAFESLLTNFNTEKKYLVMLNFDDDVKKGQLNRDLQLNLYRILQEQLRNILKHAKATKIEVMVTKTGDTLQMLIADNGVGFDAKAGKGGIGLANMNRRVRLFSGTFTIDSAVGSGCKVMVEIPV